jgi:serine/threonine protein kinase
MHHTSPQAILHRHLVYPRHLSTDAVSFTDHTIAWHAQSLPDACALPLSSLLFVLLQAILHRQLVYPGHLSTEAVSFLSTALTRDPRARPDVRELLQHPFILMHTSGQQANSQQQ